MSNRRVRFIIGSMFRQGASLRWRHWLAIGFVLSLFTFMQPVIHVIGSTVVVIALVAYIYTTLSPQQQKDWEQRLVGWLKQLRHHSNQSATVIEQPQAAETVEVIATKPAKKPSKAAGAWPDSGTTKGSIH